MNNKKLQHAIALALASVGMMVAADNVSATQVYYNKQFADAYDTGSVDGYAGVDGADFTGLTLDVRPFGYAGEAPVNWAVHLTSENDNAIVSVADALDRYGIAADIDTAIGAWNDGKYPHSQGWIHQTDEALIKSDITQYVTISLAGATAAPHHTYTTVNTDWTFGISVFEGMDTGTNFWAHAHDSWNGSYCPASEPECVTPSLGAVQTDNPAGTQGLAFKTFSDNSSVTFLAEAGLVYTLFLGGNNYGHYLGNVSEYQATITSSAVPIPMAGWLFSASLLTIFGSFGRKPVKSKSLPA